MPELRALFRAPLWLIAVLLLAAIGVGTYAYFTTPLPYGLGEYIHTPGGTSAAPTPGPGTAPAARAGAGQTLVLGAVSLAVQTVQRNQSLTTNNAGGPPGTFTLVDLVLQNAGSQPVTAQASDFFLVDAQGRSYAVDPEATRAANTSARHRLLFDASVPPAASIETVLAFEVPPDASGLVLRATLGYGELVLPQ